MFSRIIYSSLVESRKSLKDSYCTNSGLEKHHIVPKHAGGTDEDNNFTYLTHREHVIAHYLLWRIHKQNGDRIAYQWMNGDLTINIGFHGNHSDETRKKMSEAAKGRSFSEEWRKKLSEAAKRRIYTEETRSNMANRQFGKKQSAKTIAKRVEKNRGKKRSEEQRKRIKEGWIKRKNRCTKIPI